jgi:hypothetical protein
MKEKNREHLASNNYPLVSNLKKICDKIFIMSVVHNQKNYIINYTLKINL